MGADIIPVTEKALRKRKIKQRLINEIKTDLSIGKIRRDTHTAIDDFVEELIKPAEEMTEFEKELLENFHLPDEIFAETFGEKSIGVWHVVDSLYQQRGETRNSDGIFPESTHGLNAAWFGLCCRASTEDISLFISHDFYEDSHTIKRQNPLEIIAMQYDQLVAGSSIGLAEDVHALTNVYGMMIDCIEANQATKSEDFNRAKKDALSMLKRLKNYASFSRRIKHERSDLATMAYLLHHRFERYEPQIRKAIRIVSGLKASGYDAEAERIGRGFSAFDYMKRELYKEYINDLIEHCKSSGYYSALTGKNFDLIHNVRNAEVKKPVKFESTLYKARYLLEREGAEVEEQLSQGFLNPQLLLSFRALYAQVMQKLERVIADQGSEEDSSRLPGIEVSKKYKPSFEAIRKKYLDLFENDTKI